MIDPVDLPTPANPNPEVPGSEMPDTEILVQSLRRKQGNWVEWAQACQYLLKHGFNAQSLFEATGFEPIQQNQIITAAQVYENVVACEAPAAVQEHFRQQASDVLYELRILTQDDRAKAATLCWQKKLDADQAREIGKAMKDFSRLSQPPQGFGTEAGDMVAYQCWKLARQKTDLQERSRLIARGLSYALSDSARRQIEALLTDFTVVKTAAAPRLPLYRPKDDDERPRLIPVLGRLPLTAADLKTVPLLTEIGPFRLVQHSGGPCAWVPLPGWQVIMSALDPVGIFYPSDRLALEPNHPSEEVLIVVDRSQRDWQADCYFLVEVDGNLEIQWFDTPAHSPLLGRVMVVVRPPRILDPEATDNLWLMDE